MVHGLARRNLLALAGAGLVSAVVPRPLRAADGCTPVMGDDGLYHQDWFLESFLVLPEDLAEAAAEGKRFAVMWELAGCPYCKETHFVNFARPDICSYVQENFLILQLDFAGSRIVGDFDGEELEERELRAKYGIRYTPTFQFFPETPEEIGGRSGREIEVARIAGYYEPDAFLATFRFVREKAYERMALRDWLRAQLAGG